MVALLLGWSSCIFAQEATVKGLVIDSYSRIPLIGASIRIDSTLFQVASDGFGSFSIPLPKRKIVNLIASYTGYESRRVCLQTDSANRGVVVALIPKPTLIDEVVVTGTGTPHYTKNAPVQTEVFSAKAIENAPSSSLEGLLARLSPSISVSNNAMGTFLRLNGLGNDYFIVMINGRRIYGDVGSQNDLSRIDPATVDRIELVKGASSSLYGSDAIAGVINILTKKSSSPISFASSTRIGSYGELIHSSSVGGSNGRMDGSLAIGYTRSDGWKNSEYEVDKNGTPANPNDDRLVKTSTMTKNPMVSKSAKAKASVKVSSSLSISSDADITYREVTPPTTAKGYDFLYHNQSYGAGITYLCKTNGSFSATISYDRFRYLYRYGMKYNVTYKENNGSSKFVTYYPNDVVLNNDQHRVALNAKFSYKPNTRNSIVLGLDSDAEWLKSPYRLVADRVDDNEHALFGQDELTLLPSLVVTLGARLVYHSMFGTKLTPKASLLYKYNDFNIRGSIALGYKTPTLKELYYRYERDDMGAYRIYLGNPKLKPQTSYYYATSFEYHGKSLQANITPYINRVYDMIEYKTIATSSEDKARGVEETRLYDNIKDAMITGLDASVTFKLSRNILLGGGYSYTDARNTTDGCKLKDVALHRANARCEYLLTRNKHTFSATLSCESSTKIYGDALSENYYDQQASSGYSIWKWSMLHKYPITKKLKSDLGFGIDNLFNYYESKPYGVSYGIVTPGRTVFFTVTIKYQN